MVEAQEVILLRKTSSLFLGWTIKRPVSLDVTDTLSFGEHILDVLLEMFIFKRILGGTAKSFVPVTGWKTFYWRTFYEDNGGIFNGKYVG